MRSYMEKISIIGLGWLGLPLAQYLQQKNDISVLGSKSTLEGVEAAKKLNLDCLLFNTTLDFSLRQESVKALFQCDTLIITLPPNGHHGLAKYPIIISALAKTAEYCGTEHIIFTSSISVYGQQDGIVSESSSLSPLTMSGKAIVHAEHELLANIKTSVTILRLGGLFGEQRIPKNWMQQRSAFEHPEQSVNFVHRNDVILAITEVIRQGGAGKQIYNIVCPEHPSREKYYTRIAQDHELPKPNFIEDSTEVLQPCYINGSKITQQYPFQYQHSVFEFIE